MVVRETEEAAETRKGESRERHGRLCSRLLDVSMGLLTRALRIFPDPSWAPLSGTRPFILGFGGAGRAAYGVYYPSQEFGRPPPPCTCSSGEGSCMSPRRPRAASRAGGGRFPRRPRWGSERRCCWVRAPRHGHQEGGCEAPLPCCCGGLRRKRAEGQLHPKESQGV